MSNLGQTLLIPAKGISTGVAPNNYVGMIGASSVASSGSLAGLAALVSGSNVAGLQTWAVLLSDGGLCNAGVSATGGYTCQQVYDTHWPIMRDIRPLRGFVGFYAGTNDSDAMGAGGVAQPVAIAARKEIVRLFIREAKANGQIPFIGTVHPNESSVEGVAAMPAWRLALIALGAEENCIVADTFSAVGNPATGEWLSDTYTEDGVSTSLHVGPLGGPLIGQVIADALMPFRRPTHNPRFQSVADDTTGWAWQGGCFNRDGNVNSRPDGGGTGLATDAWGAPSNNAAYSLVDGTGDVVGKWITMAKTGSLTTSSSSLTPTSAPGVMSFIEDEVFEIAYHVETDLASDTAGHELKLHSTASGSTYMFYHQGLYAHYEIVDKIFWALGVQPAATTMRWNNSIAVTAGNADSFTSAIAMLSLFKVEGVTVGTGTMAWYGPALKKVIDGDLDLNAGTFKIALAATAYTPNVDTHDFRDDLGTEVTGTNWATGGVATTVTTDLDTANNRVRVLCSDISVATVTLTDAKHAVLYKSLGGAASADPIIGYVTFDTALAPTAGTLDIDFDGTNGTLRIAY